MLLMTFLTLYTDIEYLDDLEGMIEYLGAKVGMGRVCLYCNGRGRARYGSVSAVRQHMVCIHSVPLSICTTAVPMFFFKQSVSDIFVC